MIIEFQLIGEKRKSYKLHPGGRVGKDISVYSFGKNMRNGRRFIFMEPTRMSKNGDRIPVNCYIGTKCPIMPVIPVGILLPLCLSVS